MKFLAPSFALFLSLLLVNASVHHGGSDIAARHSRLVQRSNLVLRNASGKKCRNRVNPNKPASTVSVAQPTTSSTSAKPKPTTSSTSTKKAAATPAAAPAAPAPAAPAPAAKGLINVKSSCGPSGATLDVTKTSGPNGSEDWLNCGFESPGGWQPPYVRIEDVITQSLTSALQSPSSPFKACANFIHIFEKYGNQYGIPAIMLASFAMQESSCNPNTVGGGGEQGLMQITRDKCGGAPGGNCQEPDFNIHTATKFFRATLDSNGGDVLLSVGTYNGWRRGLTKNQAFAAAHSSCCRCQNNGDYLHQFFNGWCQNINAYNNNFRLGKYFNLDVC